MSTNDENGVVDSELDDLEQQLAQAGETLELDEEEVRQLAVANADTRIARAATKAIEHVEKGKDSPLAMSEALTQRYMDMGRGMLDEGRAIGLHGRLRSKVTNIIGQDPGDVRIHTGERAAAAADALDARAFAMGDKDIYFGRGQYNPETPEGLGVLVHELTHTTDNAVGAAFSSRSGGVQYSAAEERAENAERVAVKQDGRDFEPGGEAGHSADEGEEEETLDMKKLEDAVAKLLDRNNRRAADRTGRSG